MQIESCTNKNFFQLKKERLIDTEEEELETDKLPTGRPVVYQPGLSVGLFLLSVIRVKYRKVSESLPGACQAAWH